MSKSSAPITWAQRRDKLFLTLDVPEIDAATLKVDIQEQKITIDGKSPAKDVHVELNLNRKVTAEDAKVGVHGKSTEFIIVKAEEGDYWPRLLSDSTKFSWLRVDWGKWKDEDDEDQGGGFDPSDMNSLMGGMGGMPGMMGGMGGMPGMMGGMGGMGGMPDFGGMDMDDDEEDDAEEHDEHDGHMH